MAEVFLYNHGGSANHGCEALVRTVLAHIPADIKNSVLSESPQQDIHYGIHEISNVKAAVTAPSRLSLDFLKAYLQLKKTGDYFGMDLLPYLKSIRELEKHQTEISVGGDIYCYEDYKKYIRLHQLIRNQGCKTALIGCSLEEKLFKDTEFLADMKSYDLITARESLTYKMLKDNGIDNVFLIPDSAFTLPIVETELPEGFQVGNTIGLNVSPLVVRKESSEGIILENFRTLIKYLLESSDSSIALIPHVVWKSNDDREVLSVLYEEFKETGRVVMIKDQDCRKLKYVISKCKLFVGARTHATIAAYSTGVPTLVLGYSTKSRGIAIDLFGTSEQLVVPVNEVDYEDSLLKAFKALEEKQSVYQARLHNYLPDYIGSVNELSKKIGDLVRG